MRSENAISTISWTSSIEFAPTPVALFSTREVVSSVLSATEHTDTLAPIDSSDGDGLGERGQEDELEIEVLERSAEFMDGGA